MPADDERLLSPRTLDKTHDEVVEYMKRDGHFDNILEPLTASIEEEENFLEIVKCFELECDRFCREIDLSITRAALRAKLVECFSTNKAESLLKLDLCIKKYLKSKNNDLRQTHNHHAQTFLKQFIPQSESPEPSPTPPQASPPTPPRKSIKNSPSPTRLSPSPQTRSEDMDIESDAEDEIEKPVFSPIGGDNSPMMMDLKMEENVEEENNVKTGDIKQECDNFDVEQPSTDQNNHDMDISEQNELNNTNHDQNHTGDPGAVDCDGEDDDDVSLDIDDVSSVATADLANFDDLIEVSDDEANLMGVPKKSKIPVKTLAGDIEKVKQTHISNTNITTPTTTTDTTTTTTTNNIVEPCDVPIPPMDPPPLMEPSDSSNLSRNPPRNRKSNPRYNNPDFSLI